MPLDPQPAPSPASASAPPASTLDSYDPLARAIPTPRPRKRYELHDEGFREVPKKYRRFYRGWEGADDVIAPNEALCPVCKIVIRSRYEMRAGDRVFCMTCMMRFDLVAGTGGGLEMIAVY